MQQEIDNELRAYIEQEIIPRYDNFDAAHRRDHVITVIEQSLMLGRHYDVDMNMVYAIAAYHDTGLEQGRELHHVYSRDVVMSDATLRRWFSDEQIAIMGDAVMDHRASSKSKPRTIYGRIVAEADRLIDSEIIIRRTIQFTLTHHPSLSRDEGWERMLTHLNEKYNYGGYLQLWITESDNAQRLEELRRLIADRPKLRATYDRLYDELCRVQGA
ncbi:MAG: HD domain-containing protein [Alistipes sp.]|nr:HD domain-containing protein [Alistipes sp.]